MKKVLIFVAILMYAVAGMTAPVRAQGTNFIAELNDIPVLDGLIKLADRGFSFDSPAVQIAEVYFVTALDREMVTDFYTKTLPQLGWRVITPETFFRADERLTILIEPGESEKTNVVRFLLAPPTPSDLNAEKEAS